MHEYLSTQRERIAAFVSEVLRAETERLCRAGAWGSDVTDRLLEYTLPGKMIRGALVHLGYSLVSGREPDPVLSVAAAMELTQSFLLIHDDIMDRDDQRRGKPAVHRQYADVAWTRGYLGNTEHFGHAMGICAGDIAMFLATDLLSRAEVAPAIVQRLVSCFAREIALVGVAQMSDVANAVRIDEVPSEDIITLYRYKTGRYTFSLPLMLGAMAAGAGDGFCDDLGLLGEEIGVIFQIKDDEIGLFGDSTATGKPVGSDISENKKTILRAMLFDRAPEAERETLDRLFGSDSVTVHDVQYVRSLIDTLGVRGELQQKLELRALACTNRIDQLFPSPGPTTSRFVEILHSLVAYNLKRDR